MLEEGGRGRDCFLPKTVLKQGARGKTVAVLQKRLSELFAAGIISAGPDYIERKTSRFGKTTLASLEAFRMKLYSGGGEFAGVDAEMWRLLGLPVGSCLQDMFAIPECAKKSQTVSVALSENTVTIRWRPRFAVYEKKTGGADKRLPSADESFKACVKAAIAGVLRWDSAASCNPNPLCIHGIDTRVRVEVCDIDGRVYAPDTDFDYNFYSTGYRDSNVAIYIGKPHKAIVWDAFRWRRDKRHRVKICFKDREYCENGTLSRTMEHEFGHVLGLFDAYGYANKMDPEDGCYHYGGHPWPERPLPPAFIDGVRLKRNSVMVCDYNAFDGEKTSGCYFARTCLDYEMLLFAWRDNRLQLFTDSILGKKSQAFYH